MGAGTMGAGIARVFAEAGCSVRLTARRQSSLDAARKRVGGGNVLFTTSLEEAAEGAELVVETIAEDVEAKRDVLGRSEGQTAREAILTTNTSSLRLEPLASGLERPDRFAGLHFLNPPELVDAVEIVGTEQTAPETLDTLSTWMRELGKTPVVRAPPRGLRTRRRGRLLVRRHRPSGDARARSALGWHRALRDHGPRRPRRPRGRRGQPLA